MTLEERVQQLERRVSELETQLQRNNNLEVDVSLGNQSNINQNDKAMQVGVSQLAYTQFKDKRASVDYQSIYTQYNTQRKYVNKPRRNIDMEAFIGKNVSVILASILIFIGVIVFASMFFPYLTSEMKFGLMFIGSILFTGLGYFCIQKSNNNLTVALLSCGLGTVYITLFTGNLYFKILNDIVLYVILLGWALGVYYFSRYKTVVFQVIGQSGIILSLVLCIYDVIIRFDNSYIMFITVYVIVAELLYDILFKGKGYIINVISMFICITVLSFPVMSDIEKNTSYSFLPYDVNRLTFLEVLRVSPVKLFLVSTLLGLFSYIIIRAFLLAKTNKISSLYYAIVNYGGIFTYFVIVSRFAFTSGLAVMLTAYGILMFILIEVIYKTREREDYLTFLSIIFIAIATIFFNFIWKTPIITSLIPLSVLGIYLYTTETRCKKTVFYVGLGITTVLNVIYAYGGTDRQFVIFDPVIKVYWTNVIFYLSIVVFVIACYIVLYEQHRVKSLYESVCIYLVTVSNVLLVFAGMSVCHGSETIESLRLLMILGASLGVQLLFKQSHFFEVSSNLFRQKTYVTYFIVNVFILLNAVSILYKLDDVLWAYILGVVFVLALSMLNSVNLLNQENKNLSVYVGIKITFLIFVVMHVIEVNSFVSIILFVWAVLCILIGMRKMTKPLRVYGLILALCSAVKLVLFDISYSNSISKAFSYIVCGVLCFVISYIYTRLERASINN